MGEQRIVLEHHGDIALIRTEVGDGNSVLGDVSPRRFEESGDHPQCGAFATTRRSYQRNKFPFLY